MRKIRDTQGFTLIELMIVVVIIGILAAIAIPRFSSVSDSAKQAEAEPILKQMCTLAEAFEMRTGGWPANTGEPGLGWTDPQAEYYDSWTYGPDTASASKTADATAGMQTPEMNCTTRVITWS